MGACFGKKETQYIIALDKKAFKSELSSNVQYFLPQFKMSFLYVLKKNKIQELLKQNIDTQNLQLLLTVTDNQIAQAKNEEYLQVQKIKQKYYDKAFSQQKELQTLAQNNQLTILKLKEAQAQQAQNKQEFVKKFEDLKYKMRLQKSDVKYVLSLLKDKSQYLYHNQQRESYQSKRQTLIELVEQTKALLDEYKMNPEYVYTQEYIQQQSQISIIQNSLKSEAIRFQKVFSNINYFDKQTYKYLVQIKDDAFKRLSSQKSLQKYFWEDMLFNQEIQKLIDYKFYQSGSLQEKEIYLKEGNYGYYNDVSEWISVAQDQFILKNYHQLQIDGSNLLSVQDPQSIQNHDQIKQDFVLIFDSSNIDVQIAQIFDFKDLGQVDQEMADIAGFDAEIYAGTQDQGSLGDIDGGGDDGDDGDGGDGGDGGGDGGGGGGGD